MADFSKLTHNGTTYNVKDATARDAIAQHNAHIEGINGNLDVMTEQLTTAFGRIEDLENAKPEVNISYDATNETLTIG